MLGLGIDLGLRVQGVEDEAGSRRVVDVLELLQMIGVAADRLRPAGLEGTPGRVVQHIARSPMAAAHLPNGLLGEDGIDCGADCLQRSHVAGRRQPEPVAEAGRGMQPEAGGCQPGQRVPQRQGILCRGLGDETDLAVDPLCRARETANTDSSSATATSRLPPSADRSNQ